MSIDAIENSVRPKLSGLLALEGPGRCLTRCQFCSFSDDVLRCSIAMPDREVRFLSNARRLLITSERQFQPANWFLLGPTDGYSVSWPESPTEALGEQSCEFDKTKGTISKSKSTPRCHQSRSESELGELEGEPDDFIPKILLSQPEAKPPRLGPWVGVADGAIAEVARAPLRGDIEAVEVAPD